MPTPSFDNWTIIFLFIAFQGLVTSIAFFIKKNTHKKLWYIAVLLILFSVMLVDYVLYWTNYQYYIPQLAGISASFPFLFGPVLFIYLQGLLKTPHNKKIIILHFIPAIVALIYLAPFYSLSAEEKRAIMVSNGNPENQANVEVGLFNWLQLIHMLSYSIACLWYIVKSEILSEMKKWALGLALCYAGFVLASVSYYVLIQFPFFNREWDYMIAFSMSVFIFFIAIFAFIQPKIFDGYAFSPESIKEIILPEKYRNSGINAELSKKIYTRMNLLMQEEKLYSENDLCLDILAGKLNVSRHHLSQVINEQTGMNFFDYINSLRIAEAKALLLKSSRQEMNIIEVAYTVGYNNKVSFNKTFKKLTGLTPTAYRMQEEKGKSL